MILFAISERAKSIFPRKKIINLLSDNLSVLIAHEKILRNALNSEIDDYEDAVIDELSKNEELDYKKSKNTIYNAVEAIEIIERESNGTA